MESKNAQEEKVRADLKAADAEAEKTTADLARKATEKALAQAKKELLRFESMHYIDHIVAADKAIKEYDLISAKNLLEECRWDLRNFEYAYLRKQMVRKARDLLGHTKGVNCLAVSLDGKRLYSGSWDTTIKVWNREMGKEIQTLQGYAKEVGYLILS